MSTSFFPLGLLFVTTLMHMKHTLPKNILELEHNIVRHRRQTAKRLFPDSEINTEAAIKGIALSGGGIRAAFIAKGLIEVFKDKNALEKFDYISSVSGGGYASCMLSEHVGRLGKSLPFSAKNYPTTGPKYNLLLAALALPTHLLINFIPLLSYLSLLFLIPTQQSSYWLLFLAFAIFLSVNLISRHKKGYKNPILKDLEFSIATGFFLLSGSLVLFYGGTEIFGLVSIAFILNSIYVTKNPHRFYRGQGLIFVVLLSSLYGTLSSFLVNISLRYAKPSVVVIFIFSLSLVLVTSLLSVRFQNQMNLLFICYKNSLEKAFLPFSQWLTKSNRLYELKTHWNPLPIINTSAHFDNGLHPFELTPNFSGSEKSGYYATKDWLPELSLGQAMAISGGAVDFVSKNNSLLGMFLGGTYHWIPRAPLYGKKLQAHIGIENLLILAGSATTKLLRLSDGGFTDNLGVLALIKRRVKVIVCLDAGYDPQYDFEDLRKLCVTIRRLGIGELFVNEIDTASQARRFRQNKRNFLTGVIRYPTASNAEEETGLYIHIKISSIGLPLMEKYEDFPHFPTSDQLLTESEIEDLYRLGRQIASEFCDSETAKHALNSDETFLTKEIKRAGELWIETS